LAKSKSTEKSKTSPRVSQFDCEVRTEKQRGKVPSKLPAFPAALLSQFQFAAKRFSVVSCDAVRIAVGGS
jgi:hypothetical protein